MPMSKRARKRIVVLLVVVAVMAALTAGGYQWRQMSRASAIAESREDGLRLYAEGRWPEALDRLNEQARFMLDDAEVMVAMAESRRRVPLESGRHLAGSISYAQQALVTEPANTAALELLLELYTQVNQVTELVDIADRLLEEDPAHAEALWARARALVSLGRPGATQAIDRFIAAHPGDVRGHGLRLQEMLSLGAGREDVRAYADGLAETYPRSAEFLLLQAEARVRTSGPGEGFDDLRAAAERASGIEIERPETLARLVQLLDMLGLEDRASELLERELDAGAGAAWQDAVTVAVERDWKAGRIDLARDRALEAAGDASTASDAILGWSVLLAPEGAPIGSDHPNYQVLRLRDSVDARFWIHLIDGREALGAENWGTARESLLSALMSPAARGGSLAPLDIAEYLLGRAELSLGAWREAASRWERVASRNPGWIGVRLELSSLMLENGLPREAFDQAGRVLARRPGSYDAGKAAARAMVVMLETGAVPVESSDETVALIQELRAVTEGQSDTEHAQILALEARTRLVRDETDLAQRGINRLAALREETGAAPPDAQLVALLDRAEEAGLTGLDRLAPQGTEGSAELIEREARKIAALGRLDEARAVFTRAVENAAPERKNELRRREAIWLESVGNTDGLELLLELAEGNPRSAQAQIDLLNAPSVWSREDAVTPAIARLRAVGGEGSIAWRIYEARRLLTFDVSEARAAQAVELLGPGLRSSAPDAAALALAGEAMLALDDLTAAADYYGRAIDSDRRRVAIYPRLIAMLQTDGRLDLAEARLREFARLSNVDTPTRRRRAELAEAIGLWDLAVVDRRQLASTAAARPLDRARLAAALARHEQVREADVIMNALAEEPLDDASAVSLVADYLAARDRFDEALAVIEQASLSRGARARIAAAVLAERGRLDDAIAQLERAEREDPTPSLYATLAQLELRRGRLDAAQAAIDAGLALDPQSSELAALSAAARLQSGEAGAGEALALLAEAATGSGFDPVLNEVIDATRRLAEDEDLGIYIETLERLTASNPPAPLLARLLATAHLQTGNADRAVQTVANLARLLPNRPEAAQLAAEVLAQTGRLTEAESMTRRWLAQASDPYQPRIALAQLALAQNDPGAAIRALEPVRERVLAEADDAPGRVEILASAYARSGRAGDARAMLEGRAGSSVLWTEIDLSVASQLNAPAPEIREWFERAEAAGAAETARPQLAQAWFSLAGTTRDPADFARVVTLLESAPNIALSPAVMLLAISLEQVGRADEAEERYRQALELIPGQPVALNNLAYLLNRQGPVSGEAVDLAQRAVASATALGYPPDQLATFKHTLGTVLVGAGRGGEAEAIFREALTAAPLNPAVLLSLAELLADTERGDEAPALFARIDPADDSVAGDADFRSRYEALKRRLAGSDPDS